MVLTILLSSLLIVPTIVIYSSAQLPSIEAHLITSPSDYKLYGYDNVEKPYVYRKHVLSDAHIPLAIKIDKTISVARGFLRHIIAKQHGYRPMNIEYLILVNQTYTVQVPIYSTSQVNRTVFNNETGQNETVTVNETYISGWENETRYKYVWKPIDEVNLARLEPDRYYIFDIHGTIKPATGRFAVDIVPELCLGRNRIQLKQFAWWYSNWQYRKRLVISNAVNDYQMKITVYKVDGYDDPTNATIDTEGHCNDNFSDIRFANETSELPYWIEEKTDGDHAIIWVKLPSDIESQTEQYIYMYYMNPSATTTSSGSDTWIFYEEWTTDWTGQYITIKRSDKNDYGHYRSITNVSIPYRQLTKLKVVAWDYDKYASLACIGTTNDSSDYTPQNGIFASWDCDTDRGADASTMVLRLFTRVNGTTYISSEKNFPFSLNTWYKNEIKVTSSQANVTVYSNDYSTILASASLTNIPTSTGAYHFYQEITSDIYEPGTTWAYHGDPDYCIGWGGYRGYHISHIELYSPWTCIGKYADPEPTWSSFESETTSGKPQFSSISPSNGATGVIPTYNQGVNTSAYIFQHYGKTMNITFYWNDSGVWKPYASWTNVGNGTYYAWNANFTALNTTYEWAINVTIYGEPQNYTNQTYSFTTLDDILPAWFIANEDSTSITLEWGTSPQADSYYIRYDTIPHSTWTPTTGTLLVNTTSTTYTHTGLTAGTTYYYALFVWNNTYGYSTEYKEDHANTPYTTPNVVISNIFPSDGQIHVEIVNNPPDPSGYVNISFDLNDTDGGGDMEYWLYIFDWNTYTWVNRIHLTDQANQTVTQHETLFNTAGTYYYYRICTLEGGQYNNVTVKFRTDRKPSQPIAINPLNNSYVESGNIPLKVVVYHPDYEYGWIGVEFDGANDDVRVPDDPSLNLTSSFTIDFAIWIDTLPNDGQFDTIISKMTDANTGWGVAIYNDNGNAELMICVDGHNQTVGTSQLQPQTWLYLTVVFDNDTHTMYVYQNGTLVYSYSEPNTPSPNTADIVIGECSYVGNDKTFDGKMDYIRVYNVALTPDEVMANFYGKNDQCVKRGLVSWWKLDENTGTTVTDSWGSNDGTLEDGATWTTSSSTTTTYYGRVYNVTFYTYPGGKLIGYNYSASGFDNGEIVTCNNTYYAPYDGTTYYWYAVAYDDEYNTSSPTFKFTTYYNDTEPDTIYFSLGANIYVQPLYTDTEPDTIYYAMGADVYVTSSYTENEPSTVYYTLGSNISVMYPPILDYEFPKNDSAVPLGSTNIGIYAYKQGVISNWIVKYYLRNSTTDFTLQDTQNVVLGKNANNLMVNDTLTSGTFVNTTTNASGLILSKQTAEKTNTNYNANWQYYQELGIDNNGYTGYYQMQLNVSYNGGGDVSCNGHCNQNFSDLRFVQIDNTTELPYWIEKKVDGNYALLWVNVSSQAMSDGKILMYYGNSGASSGSNGDNTFLFFDDFTTDTTTDYTSITDSKRDAHFIENVVSDVPAIIEYRFKITKWDAHSIYGTRQYVGFADTLAVTPSNGRYIITSADADEADSSHLGIMVENTKSASSNIVRSGKTDVPFSLNTYYIIVEKFSNDETKMQLYSDDRATEIYSLSNTNNIPTAVLPHLILRQYHGSESGSTYAFEWDGSTHLRWYGKRGTLAEQEKYIDWILVRKYADPEPTWNITAPYHSYGYRESPEYSLSGRAKSTKINWIATTPAGTSVSVYYNLYDGTTWSGWQLATNGGSISGISDGTLLDGYKIKFKVELSTTDTSVTPILHNLTLNIDGYTKLYINVPVNTVDTYYWYVYLYNETTNVDNQTQIYVFNAWEYQEAEPSTVYYTLGADITVIYPLTFSNEYPANNSVNVPINTQLKADVSKQGKKIGFDVYFETNDTINGNWSTISTEHDIFDNITISTSYYGLEPGKTYWWHVRFVNTSIQAYYTTPIYKFTANYTDAEPNTIYFTLGADIYVQPPYTDTEPNIVYYSIGANIPVSPPHPQDPIPANNTSHGSNNRYFSVFIYDVNENDTIDKVEFYIDGGKYGEVTDVQANTRASIYVTGLTNYTWHSWYVIVYDENWTVTSDTWYYRPANSPPVINENPENESINVAVYRKLVTGEWKRFVRLYWNLTDADGDGMSFRLWVKNPSTGEWIQRWSILDYSMHNGSYYQDEELFSEIMQTYYWKVWVSDGTNESTYIFHFTTQFFIDIWWQPEYPTTDDTVQFYSLTEGADDFRWEFGDGTNVTGVTETIHRYPIAGLYDVTLRVYNATNDVWGSLTKTIRIDWNVTLNTTDGGAGINYIATPLDTNASTLASLLLRNGEWIHKFNSTTQSWESIWMYNGTPIGDNFNINQWDGLAVVVGTERKVRINITEPTNTTQVKTIDAGYHYIGWSDTKELISVNASQIGLQPGDWVFLYDTKNGTWYGYRVNFAGDTFIIKPHHVMVVNVGGERHIHIPPLGGG